MGPDYNDHDLIVATAIGTPVSPRNLLRSFKRLLQEAELPNIRFHELRHSVRRWLETPTEMLVGIVC